MINNILRELTGSPLRSITSGAPELVRNGDFSQPLSTDDWFINVGGTISIVNGVLRVENTSASYRKAAQRIDVENGATYRLIVDATDDSQHTGNQARVYVGENSGGLAYGDSGALSTPAYPIWDYEFTASSTFIYIILICHSFSTGEWTNYDNVSLKKV